MTVLDLITRAMRLLGALNIGDAPTAAESQDALLALNAMVDAWATEKLMLYTRARNLYSLVAGQQVYQIGPAGPDWIAPRPMYIDAAGLVLLNSDPTQVVERPLRILSELEYAAIRVKGLTSTLPTKLYYDRYFNNPDSTTAPVGSANVYLWPCPTIVNEVALYTPQAIAQFTGLTQTIALPPGYARALPYNLAVELAPEFDRAPSEALVAVAVESKASLKRANVHPERVHYRDQNRYGSNFDWTIGELR